MPTSRLLVIPAAGLGSRLGGRVPKLLVPVGGRPMIDRILDLYRDHVNRVVIVVNPAVADQVRRHVEAHHDARRIECVEQAAPTGMLDAIMTALPHMSDASSVWVTWCDQVAVRHSTTVKLSLATRSASCPPLVMPTVIREDPYIHFERDRTGRITRVLHRREGDVMPRRGEGDIGLFALSRLACMELLPQYAREVEIGGATGERNFLPFIPWLSREHEIVTFACAHPMEAVGVNTPEELRMVENYLADEGPA